MGGDTHHPELLNLTSYAEKEEKALETSVRRIILLLWKNMTYRKEV